MKYLLVKSRGKLVEKKESNKIVGISSKREISIIDSKECEIPFMNKTDLGDNYMYLGLNDIENAEIEITNKGEGYTNEIKAKNILKTGEVFKIDENTFMIGDVVSYRLKKPSLWCRFQNYLELSTSLMCVYFWILIIYNYMKGFETNTDMSTTLVLIPIFLAEYSIMQFIVSILFGNNAFSMLLSLVAAIFLGAKINTEHSSFLSAHVNEATLFIILLTSLTIVFSVIKNHYYYLKKWNSSGDFDYFDINPKRGFFSYYIDLWKAYIKDFVNRKIKHVV